MYRILVVDDEEKIRTLIRKYAEFEGNKVEEAQNGMEAVERCRRDPRAFDIIIMDVMMPELDGFSAVAEIRKTCDTPVLMLSARGEEYDRIHGFELGGGRLRGKTLFPQGADDAGLRHHEPGAAPGGRGLPATSSPSRGSPSTWTPASSRWTGSGRSSPQGVRPAGVHGPQQKHRPDPGNAHHQRVGYDFYGDDRTLDTHIKLLRKSLGPLQRGSSSPCGGWATGLR